MALALIAALAWILIPFGTAAVQPRLEARFAWDSVNGVDFGVGGALELPLWRGL